MTPLAGVVAVAGGTTAVVGGTVEVVGGMVAATVVAGTGATGGAAFTMAPSQPANPASRSSRALCVVFMDQFNPDLASTRGHAAPYSLLRDSLNPIAGSPH
jgi:hypothetical protein